VTPAALVMALLLGREPFLVSSVARSFPADPALAVALVEYESGFDPTSWCYEYDSEGKVIGTSWGLWRLFSKYHPQHRDNLAAHIQYGAGFLLCLMLAHRRGGDACYLFSLSAYNAGSEWSKKGLAYAQRVLRVYDRLRGRIGG